jgi:hypothetical protein
MARDAKGGDVVRRRDARVVGEGDEESRRRGNKKAEAMRGARPQSQRGSQRRRRRRRRRRRLRALPPLPLRLAPSRRRLVCLTATAQVRLNTLPTRGLCRRQAGSLRCVERNDAPPPQPSRSTSERRNRSAKSRASLFVLPDRTIPLLCRSKSLALSLPRTASLPLRLDFLVHLDSCAFCLSASATHALGASRTHSCQRRP